MILRPLADETRLAAARHELRAPLAGIAGLAELLLDSPLTDEQRALVSAIRSSAEHCAHVADVVTAAGPAAPPVAVEVDLVELLRTTVLLFRAATDAKGLALRLHLAPGLPSPVRGDPVKLRQILVNLIANAVKFTDHGAITVRVEANGDGVRFEVVDTGIGLVPLTVADRASRAGTGLGLVISRQLVSALGGEGIEVGTSDAGGSRFSFTLPLAPLGGEPAERRDRARAGRILVADDDLVTQQVLRALVGRLGFHAEVATSGEAVLAQWERGGLDAVLLDYRLAGTDGIGVAREIRRREAATGQARLPLIAVTASTSESDRTRCLAAGMDAFLVKPVDVADLGRVLDHLLGHHPAATSSG